MFAEGTSKSEKDEASHSESKPNGRDDRRCF